jgi:hypothetical protein
MDVHIAAPRPGNGDGSRKFLRLPSLERMVTCLQQYHAPRTCEVLSASLSSGFHPQLSLQQQQLRLATVTRIEQKKISCSTIEVNSGFVLDPCFYYVKYGRFD